MKSKSILSIVAPGLVGNILEWYDFALYGYFAHIISPVFFPSDNKLISLITTFSVFAIGFIMRPVGALLFGHMGDRYGRKKSLSLAILLMAIPTTLIGCLPSYQSIGLLAPLLLLLMRLLQGLAVGGEFTGSMVYIIEHVNQKKRGFYSSLVMSSAFIGLLLGSLMALLVDGLDDNYPNLWRAAFILSFVLGFIGLYLRMGMPESPAFQELRKEGNITFNPIKKIFREYPMKVFLGFLVVMLPTAGFYLCFLYMASYLNAFIDIKVHEALFINSTAMLFIILGLPCVGYVSDKVGIYKTLYTGGISFLLLSIPLFYLINTHDYFLILLSEIIFACLVAISFSAIPIFLVNLFPADIRYTGISLPYNLATALIGGTIPLVSTVLIYYSNNNYAPAIYLSFIALLSLLGLIVTQKKFV